MPLPLSIALFGSPDLCGPGQGLSTTWDLRLIILSVAIAVVGSFVSLELATRMRSAQRGRIRQSLFAGGAAMMGLTIWSMHFIGMTALQLPVPLSYDGVLSFASMIAAACGAGLAFWITDRSHGTISRLGVAGTAMGIAIASMHYIGMDSMRMPALIHYAWSLFALSIVIAVVASIAAIMISRSLRSGPHSLLWSKAGSAVIMGAAIAGMHYVGMAAACYEPVASVEVSELNAPLVGSVSLSTLLIIAGVIFIGTTIALGVQATAEREQALASYRQLAAELELKVAERTSALERVNQELTAFSYSVAHDLRAPLRSLSGFSALLRKSLRDRLTPESERHLAKIHASADRMNELIDGLLALSNISRQQLKPTRVDLGAIARRILADLGAVERDRQVEVRIPDDLVVEGDAALLTSALENLLGNAWKFTRDRPVAKIELGCFTRDDHAVYFVRDNGAGFEMNRAQKLFNAFERLHTAEGYPGTGVGLATTKRIVERHGGSIWAEAKINEGATFFFTLDRSASTPLPVPAQDLSLSR